MPSQWFDEYALTRVHRNIGALSPQAVGVLRSKFFVRPVRQRLSHVFWIWMDHVGSGRWWIWILDDLGFFQSRPFSTKVWTSPSHNPSHVIPPVAGAASKRSVCCSRLLRRSLARMACGLWEAGQESFKIIQGLGWPGQVWNAKYANHCQSF